MRGKKRTTRTAKAAEADSDANRSKEDILAIATEEFAVNGLSGARVDAIAEKTQTSKRMIYYYFGGKEGLYRAVLQKAYADIRQREAQSHLNELPPVEAIRKLVELTFDYDETHVNFIRLVAIENIHRGKHLAKLPTLRDVNASAIETLSEIMKRGRAEGAFRADVDPLDVHLLISAFCFFRVSNRHTLGLLFGRDLSEPKLRKKHRKLAAEAVLRLLRPEAGAPES
jgi:AcrR family transcriptional regulator